LVRTPQRRRPTIHSEPSVLSTPTRPNAVWGIDYKGWFRTGDGKRCDPLTISDLFSRYLLECRAVKQTNTQCAQAVLERIFRQYGLPEAIRSDSGSPFASTGLGGLTAFSVWWVKLGIRLERIVPGRPDQNGCHERMHRTLKDETARPPRADATAQQRCFNSFRRTFNTERPHEALNNDVPAQWYQPSNRAYPERIAEVEYPARFEVRRVRSSGEIRWHGELIYVSEALVGEPIGLEEVNDRHWKIRFGPIELALLDTKSLKLLVYRRPNRRRRARVARAVVENSSRPPGSLRSPQPKKTSQG
jgi:putative transposase